MGNLHAGHYALVERAQQQAQTTILTIYINPMQFAPTEDLAQYPRTLDADLELCRAWGVDVVLVLSDKEMYPYGLSHAFQLIPPKELDDCYYGKLRPHFFTGVSTVVCKLFTLIQPHIAVFGLKDAQQYTIIQRMVKDMQLPLNIIGVYTARDEAGLALSSRNQYLSDAQKQDAQLLSQTLLLGQALYKNKSIPSRELLNEQMLAFFNAQAPDSLVIDYIDIVDIETFQPVDAVTLEHFMIIAAHYETSNMSVRLLDTLQLCETPLFSMQAAVKMHLEKHTHAPVLV